MSDSDPSTVTGGTPVLRTATLRDVPELVALTSAFYEEDGFHADAQALPGRYEAFLGQQEANVSVAERAGELVGFALTTVRLILERGPVAELQDLYVRPHQRRQGVGAALVRDAARWARSQAGVELEVVVAPNGRDVSHLHRFYAALGFQDEGRRLLHRDL